jgi:hypothetical protein
VRFPDLNLGPGGKTDVWTSVAELPLDHFSLTIVGPAWFDPGSYVFVVGADDGIRFFLDGQLIIDQWRVTSYRTYRAGPIFLEGQHTILVQYYENTGLAGMSLTWEQVPE